MDKGFQDLPDEDIQAIEAPTLVMIGDSDLVRPEHVVEMFRLRGGGVSVVLDNMLGVSGDSGESDPSEQLEHGPGHVERLARMGCETVRILAELDAGTAVPAN